MHLRGIPLLGTIAALVLLLAACDPNPEPEDACIEGTNGGNPVIIVAGTFSPGIANQLFLGTHWQPPATPIVCWNSRATKTWATCRAP